MIELPVMVVAAMLLGANSIAVAAGDANRVECPKATEESPGFRAYLPDCRAYELVSPPFTNGFNFFGFNSENFNLRVSAAGDTVGGVALGSFAGAPFNYINAVNLGIPYVFHRGESGWGAESEMPTSTELPSPVPIDADSALQRSLWASGDNSSLHGEFTAVAQLYIRASDGQFTPVGPLDRPTNKSVPQGPALALQGYAGASANLSRIVLRLEREAEETPSSRLWPGDETIGLSGAGARPSLYEYTGTGKSEPSLVGVKTEGSLEELAKARHLEHLNEASINEAHESEQITQCGTVLGSGAGYVYNAVSPSGFGVFFSALPGPCTGEGVETGTGPKVKEIYVRVGGVKTLNISEPPLTVPGRECTGVCEESQKELGGHVRSEGKFVGASEDGHRVYFISNQPLVNADKDATADLYMEELNEHDVTKLIDVSVGGTGDLTPGEGALVDGVARISEDGGRAYFVAKGALTTTANANGEAAVATKNNLYVFDAGTGDLAFVGQLAQQDKATIWGEEDTHKAQTSANDGRYFIFISRFHLLETGDTSGNGSNVGQLFEYDAEEHSVTRVSVGKKGNYLCQTTLLVEPGYNCNGNVQSATLAPEIRRPSYARKSFATQAASSVNVTPDGTVFFESPAALTPGAANGFPNAEPGFKNIYEFREGQVYLISDGVEPATGGTPLAPTASTHFLSATNDDGALFFTADPLVPQDTNSQASLYDAHANGGFPAPPAAHQCAGESCRGVASSAGVGANAASTASQGLGNVHRRKKHKKKHHGHGRQRRAGR